MIHSASLLKQVDRWGWLPGALAGKALAWIVRWFRKASKLGDETLIVRPGGMGDLILLSLALRNLGISFSSVTWLIEKRSEPWAIHLGLNYLCYNRAPLQVLLSIAGRFSRVVNSEQFFGLSQAFALAALGQQGELIGFSTNRARWFSTRNVSYDPLHAQEYSEFVRLISEARPTVVPGVLESPQSHPNLQSVQRRTFSPSGQIVVAIAGLQVESRQLTLDQWVAFIAKQCGAKNFILSASPEDSKFQMELARHFGKQCEVSQGNFGSLCELISRAEKVITVDGGMVHVASYWGVPCTVVFTSGRSLKWHPLGEGSQMIVRRDLSCQPCTLFGQVPRCDHRFACKDLDLS